MKTTLTFEVDDNDEDARIELENHLRGPSIAEALVSMYGAVYAKVHGQNTGAFNITPDEPPADKPPESWKEVLDLLDEHTSDVADLL